MLETICPRCKERYQLGADHTCPKKTTAKQIADALADPDRFECHKSMLSFAETQAPPVDAIHPIEAMVAQGLIEAGNALLDIVRQRGRPRIHPDRKAAKAMYERDRRKRLKEAK